MDVIYVVLALQVVQIVNHVIMMQHLDKLAGNPARPILPPVNVFQLAVKAVNSKRKLRNMGDVKPFKASPETMTAFYRLLLQVHNSKAEYAMTEEEWYPIRWQKIGGTSIEQMRDAFNKAEQDGVLRRKNPNTKSTRVLASYATLRRLAGV